MSSLKTLDPGSWEVGCLGFFEGLRRLGFSAKDIYFVTGEDKEGNFVVAMRLLVQDKEWTAAMPCTTPEEDVKDRWLEVAGWWNSPETSHEDRYRVFGHWQERTPTMPFMMSILKTGIVLPKMEKSS